VFLQCWESFVITTNEIFLELFVHVPRTGDKIPIRQIGNHVAFLMYKVENVVFLFLFFKVDDIRNDLHPHIL
jgi:hypothetical protein